MGILLITILIFSSIVDLKTKDVYLLANLFIFVLGLFDMKDVSSKVLGMIIIPLTLVSINIIFKQEKIGYGDIELIACAGFLLGYTKICLAFFIATLLNTIYALAIKKDAYSFIPFLSIGILICYFF